MTPQEKLDRFVKAIAVYVTTAVGMKGVRLQMGDEDAKAWAEAYRASGCIGYMTAEETEASIRRMIGAPKPKRRRAKGAGR